MPQQDESQRGGGEVRRDQHRDLDEPRRMGVRMGKQGKGTARQRQAEAEHDQALRLMAGNAVRRRRRT